MNFVHEFLPRFLGAVFGTFIGSYVAMVFVVRIQSRKIGERWLQQQREDFDKWLKEHQR